MPPIPFSPPRAAEQIEANLEAFSLSFGAVVGACSRIERDVRWVYTGAARLNRVVGAHFDEDEADERIGQVLAEFATRGAPAAWFLGPSSRPLDLPDRLLRHGLKHRGDWTGMAADLGTIALYEPAGVEVEEVRRPEGLCRWARAITQGFEMPAADAADFERVVAGLRDDPGCVRRYYLAGRDGAPLAGSLLFAQDGIAGLYYVGTIPGARRQGLASAVTLRALGEARDLGCRVATLHAAPAGSQVYSRFGFRPYCTISIYDFRP